MTTTPTSAAPRSTTTHKALGAKLVPFAGWEMPVQYAGGILAEHHAVRTAAGCSTSPTWASSRSPAPTGTRSSTGSPATTSRRWSRAGCSTPRILTPEGTFVDDCTVYRFDDKLMIVVNASNVARAWEHIVKQKGGANVRLKDISDEVGLLALQGPAAQAMLQPLTDTRLDDIAYYHFDVGQDRGRAVLHLPHRLHRRGRLRAVLPRPRHRRALECAHRRRRQADRPRRPRLAPAGDGLRPLRQRHRRHHHAARGRAGLDREAGQGLALHGRQGAARSRRQRGVTRKLVGFRLDGRGFPRHGYPVYHDGRDVDVVRSGTMSPSLGQADRHDLPAGGRREDRAPGSRSSAGASGCRRRW